MRQLSLDPSSGALTIRDVPRPATPSDGILVQVAHSLVSSGTERSKVDLASKPLWQKAQERPDQVRKVLESVSTEGIVATAFKVRQRLSAPQPLGYSLSGIVIGVGERCEGFCLGMPVACGGVSASHAEVVAVPRNLAVPVPEGAALPDAAFATVASVALHGIRTGGVTLGDRVLVIGAGLIGQLTVRLCAAAGGHVFAVDPRGERAALAAESGAEQIDTACDRSSAQRVLDWSRGRGADVVLITAGGSGSDALELAGAAARDRARVVVVGAVGLEIPRELFYEKELSLIVSRSYGPGRYDPEFEDKGYAYPPGFVPWTERRNMEEILSLLASGRLALDGLRVLVPFEQAPKAYELLGSASPPISIVLDYEGASRRAAVPTKDSASNPPSLSEPTPHIPRPLRVSFVGMGNFASTYLLPAVKPVAESLEYVVTGSPLKAEHARKRSAFRAAATDARAAIEDPRTDVVFIATRHDTHARYVEAALRAGKAVFVEKPLALTLREYDLVATAQRATAGRLMVGFNRRFAPATAWALAALGSNRSGLRLIHRVNAGALPAHHWLLDPDVGGGRLLGEGCHFIDLACHIAGAPPRTIEARPLDPPATHGHQSYHIEITFANGATAGIEYLSGGDASLPKEWIEIHRSGLSIVIDDFRSAAAHRGGKRSAAKSWPGRDKGHRAEVRAFLEAVREGRPTPIPEEESLLTTALTLAAARSVREGRGIHHDEWPR
jgi:polar amino acid transport system substrate-binding protein